MNSDTAETFLTTWGGIPINTPIGRTGRWLRFDDMDEASYAAVEFGLPWPYSKKNVNFIRIFARADATLDRSKAVGVPCFTIADATNKLFYRTVTKKIGLGKLRVNRTPRLTNGHNFTLRYLWWPDGKRKRLALRGDDCGGHVQPFLKAMLLGAPPEPLFDWLLENLRDEDATEHLNRGLVQDAVEAMLEGEGT